MTASLLPVTRQCAFCGTGLPGDYRQDSCPTCGAPLAVALPRLDPHLQAELVSMNEKLAAAGARNAEDAFSLGCWMGAFGILLSGVLAFWLSGRNWILVMIVVVTMTIVATGVSTLLSLQAKSNAMRRAYQQIVGPEVETLQATHDLDAAQFMELVNASLPEDAPLYEYLPARRK